MQIITKDEVIFDKESNYQINLKIVNLCTIEHKKN
jgi:hypothetical protein